jgi:hypothetical protein
MHQSVCSARIRARIRQLRRRIHRLLVLSNPDCFDETNRLKPGRLPTFIPGRVQVLLDLIERAEYELLILRSRRSLKKAAVEGQRSKRGLV